MDKNSFEERCYSVLKKVPRGKVVTYKQIATAIGSKAYRAVGTAMKRNKTAPRVPCHRVVLSDGRVGSYNKGQKEKIRLLTSESVKVVNGKIDLKIYGKNRL